MELFKLNLGTSLRYRAADVVDIESALSAADALPESGEMTLYWQPDALILDGADGPRIRATLPRPERAGISCGSAETDLELEAGFYLFCQTRARLATEAMDAIEWFARESWWTQANTRGPYILRLVREHGKTAVQVLRSLAR